jgi:two-component system cell cycle sensor histidine kinase/response regulator CckA
MNSSLQSGGPGTEILIVEDSPTQAEEIRFILEENGFIVRHGRNGFEAMTLLDRHLPLAVISDINMPEMDGYELCRRIRSDHALAGLPVILLTSLADAADVILALECGADYFFTKPFNERLLVPRLRDIQENRHLQSSLREAIPIEIKVGGNVHHIAASRLQAVNLLLSTYESAVDQNYRLQRVEAELRQLNENLEARVQARTDELVRANEALQAEDAARRRVESRLREQAELLDKANEAIITADLDKCIKFWNRGAERLFGWTANEMKGRRLSEVFSLGGVGRDDSVSSALENIRDWRGELRSQQRSGASLILDGSVTVLRDEAGLPTGWLSISADITEEKKLQETLLRTQRLENIGMLAAGMTHDLNNVMAPIGMGVTILRSRLSGVKDVRLLDTMENCVQRGTNLIRQILGFAHGITGQLQLIQVKHLLRDLAEVLTATLPKSIVLDNHQASDLWPINGNPTHIHQVLLNLCINARDAMPEGGTLRMRAENCELDANAACAIEGGSPGTWLVLEIGDTGTGIPAEVLAHIWEPFFTTKSAHGGTGLGLSTVRGIVQVHGGFISLQTEPGCGTTFRVYLPACNEKAVSHSGTEEHSVKRGCGERILVVDDEEAIRETIRETLSSAGYEVVTANDGAEGAALVVTPSAAFALVITDYDMPRMNGVDLARLIRAHQPATKILLVSGFTSSKPAEIAKLCAIGDMHLSKPFVVSKLLSSIKQLLCRDEKRQ